MKIFTPQDAKENHVNAIPEYIIETFNELLAKKWNNNKPIKIYQDDVLNVILSKLEKIRKFGVESVSATKQEIFDNKWLDVEDIYIENGWKVIYDKPSYCESYEPYWTFTPKINL